MRTVIRLSLAFALLVPSLASAQGAEASQATPAPEEFVFTTGADVGGTRADSPLEVLTVDRNVGRHSLIRIRTEFVRELFRSADAL